MKKHYKGINGNLIITDTGILIERGLKGFFGGHGLKGNKSIPFSSITAVQFKKAGLTAGYIQLSINGGMESKGGLFAAMKEENTVSFYSTKNNEFEEAKNYIEEKINGSASTNSNLNDLEKLAELKQKGIITDDEFLAKKKAILNI